jgi:hypothetical protein
MQVNQDSSGGSIERRNALKASIFAAASPVRANPDRTQGKSSGFDAAGKKSADTGPHLIRLPWDEQVEQNL